MNAKRLLAAKKLAALHSESEPLLRKAYLLISPTEKADEPVKLLEVVDGAVEAGVMPIYFRADMARGIEYPSVIIELSPNEYKKLGRRGKLKVYDESWEIGQELVSVA